MTTLTREAGERLADSLERKTLAEAYQKHGEGFYGCGHFEQVAAIMDSSKTIYSSFRQDEKAYRPLSGRKPLPSEV